MTEGMYGEFFSRRLTPNNRVLVENERILKNIPATDIERGEHYRLNFQRCQKPGRRASYYNYVTGNWIDFVRDRNLVAGDTVEFSWRGNGLELNLRVIRTGISRKPASGIKIGAGGSAHKTSFGGGESHIPSVATACVGEINPLVMQYNPRVVALNLEASDASFVFRDVYQGLMGIISDPPTSLTGFEDARGTCCGRRWRAAAAARCVLMIVACSNTAQATKAASSDVNGVEQHSTAPSCLVGPDKGSELGVVKDMSIACRPSWRSISIST